MNRKVHIEFRLKVIDTDIMYKNTLGIRTNKML